MKLTRKQLALPAAALCALALVASGCASTRSYTTHSASQPGASLAEVGKTIPNPGTGSSDSAATTSADEPTSAATTTTTAAKAGFPVSLTGCGSTLSFAAAPENVVIIGASGAATMKELGVLDRVKFRAGEIPEGVFDQATQAKLAAIPAIESDGATVTAEELLAAEPDLVVGDRGSVDQAVLDKAGVPFYCAADNSGAAGFELVDAELEAFGKIFGVPDKAAAADGVLKGEVTKLVPQGDGLKGAVVSVSADGKLAAHGSASMAQPILEANDLTNVFAADSGKTSETTIEALAEQDPDWIVVLGDGAGVEETTKAFLALPGAADLKAAGQKRIVVLPSVLVDPPSPLSVKGAVELNKAMIQSVQ